MTKNYYDDEVEDNKQIAVSAKGAGECFSSPQISVNVALRVYLFPYLSANVLFIDMRQVLWPIDSVEFISNRLFISPDCQQNIFIIPSPSPAPVLIEDLSSFRACPCVIHKLPPIYGLP